MDLEETEARNDCAGEDQQQFNLPIDQQLTASNSEWVDSHDLEVDSWSNVLIMRQSLASKNMHTEVEECPLSGAITRQQLMKT
jgi:hypothetical protein